MMVGSNGNSRIAMPYGMDRLQATSELMPDSRARMERGTRRGPGGNWILIFCGNCGAEAGWVLAGTTFAFALCLRCAMQWGMIAHRLTEPHVEAWKAVVRAQIESYGRTLTREEVAKLLDDVNDPIAKLIRQGA